MCTGSFLGIKSGRGVTLTPHPLLVPWSWKSRAVPLLPLWAGRPVQSLSASTRVHFTLTLTIPDKSWLQFGTFLSNISYFVPLIHYQCTGCFKKSFTTLKAYRNLYRGHTQRFELSKCSKTRVLARIVIRNCFDLFFRFLLYGTSTVTVHRPGKQVLRYSRTSPK
jgi:hypothetical protein